MKISHVYYLLFVFFCLTSAAFGRDLKIGASGSDVKQWQVFLNTRGFDIATDGEFGSQTRRATIVFQRRWKLYVDGVVGPQTMQKARALGFGSNITATRPNVSSAQQAFTNFLMAWKKTQWRIMVSYTQITWRNNQEDPADILNAWFSFKKLHSYRVLRVDKISAVTNDISAAIRYTIGENVYNRTITARVICETAPYEPSIDGRWGVNPISVLRER